jgi:hypothetical protein
MILMQRFIKKVTGPGFCAIFLSLSALAATPIPPCPEGSEREYLPNRERPQWASCRDEGGLFQGLLFQFSSQSEIIRIASVKNSLRHGREIRFGAPGTIEERDYREGHLHGPSYIHRASAPVGRSMPKTLSREEWARFGVPTPESFLKTWLQQEPESTLEFSDGRLVRVMAGKLDYRFRVSKEGRIYSINHPEMKNLFFVDPEPLWDMNAADTKSLLKLGFGSCKKYDGPLGRYGRHYDVLLFKREMIERKHLARLSEIRERMLGFCVPEDIRKNLGTLECPPLLPGTLPPNHCILPLSDRLHVPYEPKYFAFEFTLGRKPEEFHELLKKKGALHFASRPDQMEKTLSLSDSAAVMLKKTPSGIYYKFFEKQKDGKFVFKGGGDDPKSWWDWKHLPGF